MWGKATGDANQEARGDLMLAIQSRSFSNYFLMESTNTVQPPRFIGNKASGILFEGKVDHTTYFGTNIEYIEGFVSPSLPMYHLLGLTKSS
jgi:endo-1,3(4)-beta-glucanase